MKPILYGVASLALLVSSAAFADPGKNGGHGNGGHDNGNHGNQGNHGNSGKHGNGGNHGNNGHGNGGYGNGYHSDNGRHAGWGQDRGRDYRWNRGERMGYNDWNSAPRVDYRVYHLQPPPYGYEWRRHNDQFILGAVTGGLIAAIVMSTMH